MSFDFQVQRNLVIGPGRSLAEIEKQAIFYALEQTAGNKTKAADLLKISIRTLRNKLAIYRGRPAS